MTNTHITIGGHKVSVPKIEGTPSGYKWVYGTYYDTSDASGYGSVKYDSTALTSTNCAYILPVGVGENVPVFTYVATGGAWKVMTLYSDFNVRPSASYTVRFLALVSTSVFGD